MRPQKDEILTILRETKATFKKYGIEKMALFGSFAKGEATPYSDIDIAIKKRPDFLKQQSAYDYFDLVASLKEQLVKRLHRPVDIFDLDSESPLKERIERELIYV